MRLKRQKQKQKTHCIFLRKIPENPPKKFQIAYLFHQKQIWHFSLFTSWIHKIPLICLWMLANQLISRTQLIFVIRPRVALFHLQISRIYSFSKSLNLLSRRHTDLESHTDWAVAICTMYVHMKCQSQIMRIWTESFLVNWLLDLSAYRSRCEQNSIFRYVSPMWSNMFTDWHHRRLVLSLSSCILYDW